MSRERHLHALPAEPAVAGTERPGALGAPFAWYLGASASWHGAWGMQQVLFAWLVVEVLREDPAWVGTAQMMSNLPALALLLLSGVLADRVGRRRALVGAHVLAALAALAMGAALVADAITLPLLFAYAFLWGSMQSVQLPARESALFTVGERALPRAVAGATLAQFVCQAVGNGLAGAASLLGGPLMLVGQGIWLLLGLGPTARLPGGPSPEAPTAAPTAKDASTWSQVREGFGVVLGSPRLRTLAMLISFNGLLFIGPYFVLLPILLRDDYGGGVDRLSLAMMMFPIGTGLGSLLLLLRGAPRHRGAAHLLGQLGGSLGLIAIGLRPPFPVVIACVLLWGLGGSLFLNMGRTLFQEGAPDSHRARALSIYSLALLGTAPLGTVGAGLVGGWIGAAEACALAGALMLGLLGLSWLLTPIRRLA